MEKYLLLFIGLGAPPADADDAVTQDYMGRWGAYMGGLAAAGQLDAGAPLQPSGSTVTRDGVTPIELQTMDIGGFLLIGAESLAAAEKIAGQAPHTALGGSTLVRPLMAI